ncbi:hypothetical protein ACIBCR_14845 [Micromonospora echinospora]|uniref:hypothetical protein n=1 Tax=Micromonospora echinospora TaxID=1877 RepID=UPI00379C6E65
MPDAILAARPALPHTTPAELTVTRIGEDIYIGDRHYLPVDALDLSAAIARAVTEAAEHRMTNPNHTTARH